MNSFQQTMLAILGATIAIVFVILALGFLAPQAGSASAGVVSTQNLLTSLMAWIAVIIAGGITLAALSGRRKG